MYDSRNLLAEFARPKWSLFWASDRICFALLKQNDVMAFKNRKTQFHNKCHIQKKSNNKKFQGYSNFALTFDSHISNFSYCFIQFLWFFSLKRWFKGQIISRGISKIHFWPAQYIQTHVCDRIINGKKDVKIFFWKLGFSMS